MGDPKPIASVGGAWHAHDESGEAFPTCSLCLQQISDLKRDERLLHTLMEYLDGFFSPMTRDEWMEEVERALQEDEQEGDE